MKRIIAVLLVAALGTGCGLRETEKPKEKVTATPARDYVSEGVLRLQQGDPVAAVRNFDEAIKQNPLDPRPYVLLAQTYMYTKDYHRAIDTLMAATRVAPNDGEVYYLLAVNYNLIKETGRAKASAQKSVEIYGQMRDEENFLKSVALLQGLMKPEAE